MEHKLNYIYTKFHVIWLSHVVKILKKSLKMTHFLPRKSVLGPKVPQNGLKLKYKSNKCYGA